TAVIRVLGRAAIAAAAAGAGEGVGLRDHGFDDGGLVGVEEQDATLDIPAALAAGQAVAAVAAGAAVAGPGGGVGEGGGVDGNEAAAAVDDPAPDDAA